MFLRRPQRNQPTPLRHHRAAPLQVAFRLGPYLGGTQFACKQGRKTTMRTTHATGTANRHRRVYALASLSVLIALVACGGSGPATDIGATAQDKAGAAGPTTGLVSTAAAATVGVAQPANTEGRLLASNCFQCHGTLGLGGFERIRGSEASEVLEYMTKSASKDIMAAHAQGYTPEQLKKIIDYLKQ
jgi:mono/diheme cytochrome c family protein